MTIDSLQLNVGSPALPRTKTADSGPRAQEQNSLVSLGCEMHAPMLNRGSEGQVLRDGESVEAREVAEQLDCNLALILKEPAETRKGKFASDTFIAS